MSLRIILVSVVWAMSRARHIDRGKEETHPAQLRRLMLRPAHHELRRQLGASHFCDSRRCEDLC